MPPTSTFRADMLGSKQKKQLAQTGSFTASTGEQRNATGAPTVPTPTAPGVDLTSGIPATVATAPASTLQTPPITPPTEIANETKSFGQEYLNGLQQDAQTRLDQAQAPITEGERAIREAMGLLNTESDTRTKLEDTRGVTGIEEKMRQAEQSIAQQIAAIDDFDDSTVFNTEEMRIDASKRDVTKATFGAQSAEYNLQRAIARRGQAAQLRSTVAANAALQGNLELATEQVDKALKSIYDPIRQDLAMEQFFLTRNDKRFDAAQKEVSDLRLKSIDRQFAEIDRATNLVDGAVASGYASGDDIKQMTALSGNPQAQAEYALQVAGSGARQKVALERMAANASMAASAMSRRANLMELAIAGDPQAVAELGFDPGAPARNLAAYEEDKALSSQIDQQNNIVEKLEKALGMTSSINASTGFVQSGALSAQANRTGLLERTPIIGRVVAGARGAQDKAAFLADMNFLLAGEGFAQFSKLKEQGVNLTPVSELEFNKIMESANMLIAAAEKDGSRITGFGNLSPEVIQAELNTMMAGAAKIRDEKAAIKNIGYENYVELQALQSRQ